MTAARLVLRRWASLAIALVIALGIGGTAFLPAASAADRVALTPMKIMPMGDSITNGVGATGGYRLELKDLMVPRGHSFDYVGVANSGPFEIEDRQHEGRNGFKISEVAALARAEVNTYTPNVVLLLIGTNDVTTDTDLPNAPARLSGLIDTILDAQPTTTVIVGSIPPLANAADEAQGVAYNAAIPGIVQARVDAGKKVSFVDIHGALTVSDLVDGVHPNADGYLKMAQAWLPAVEATLPAPPTSSADGCPCSMWSDTDTPTVPQVASTTATEVGVRFRVEKYGQITGIRFYKGPSNTGVHKGSLWARDGRLLASATFTGETASGWQQVNFSSPVTVWPWTTYVASYFAPAGRYAADNTVFTKELVKSPVRMLAAGQSGGNGWSASTTTGAFPGSASGQQANFWVDVVFNPVLPAPPPPAPSAPGGLRTTSVASSQVGLAWNDVVGETGFRVERKLSTGTTWAPVGVAARDNWALADTTVNPSKTYSYRVIATSRNGDSAPSAALNNVTTPAAPTPPAPGGVSATAVSPSAIDVAWQDVAGESGYEVERSANGTGGWTSLGSVGANAVTFSDTVLTASTTYFYRVVATSANGNSPPSAVVSATTLAPPAPPTPSGVSAAAVSASRIDVGWQDVAGETSYRVERSANGSGGWTEVGATVADAVAFSDTGLDASRTYFYRVVAVNGSGASAPSSVVSATTAAPPPPATPAGVSATAVSSSSIDVAWDDVAGESGYRVERSASGNGGWTQVATTGADEVSYVDTGLAASTTYFYRVVAVNATGVSAPSSVVSATTTPPPPPPAPTGVSTAAVSSTEVDVVWHDVAGETSYLLEGSANGGGWTEVATVGADVVSYAHTGLTPSTTYSYRVVARNAGGASSPSAVVSATTEAPPPPPPPPVPPTPTGVSATAVSSSGIDVAWQDVAGETEYRVQRSADGSPGWVVVGSTAADVVTYADTGLTPSTTYSYRVVAVNSSGASTPSAMVSATTATPAPPPAPTGVSATAVSSSRIDVAWQDIAGESGYQLQRSADGSTGWTQVVALGADIVTYADTGLAASTAYSYRVVATSNSGSSSPSTVVSATTLAPPPPPAPGGVTATAMSSSRIDVRWQDVVGETGYQVQRSADGISGWSQVGTTAANVLMFSNAGLAPSRTYYYRVIATSANGNSAPSVVVSETTAADTATPTAPSNLKATAAKRKINLAWTGSTDTGSGVAGYRVYRSTSGSAGPFTLLTTTMATSASVDAPTGAEYWYRVTAYDFAGNESAPSGVVSAKAK